LIVLYIHNSTAEGFNTKREKAQAIYNWFSSSTDHKYSNYKADMKSQSNIVEYEDVMSLFKNKNLTVESVENII
jgi:hypothetical protein